jgi:hypothetical protein
LLDSIPKDSQPRADKDGELERIKANKWMLANLAGKVVEFRAVVSDVEVGAAGDAFSATVVLGELLFNPKDPFSKTWKLGQTGTVRAGGLEWTVLVVGGVKLEQLDEAAVKRIRATKGKEVTIGITLEKPEPEKRIDNTFLQFIVHDDPSKSALVTVIPSVKGRPYLNILARTGTRVTIDGFDPMNK